MSALVRREGLRIADGEAESFVKRVAALVLPGRLMAEVAPLLSPMLHLNEQIAFRRGKKTAVVALARKLAGILFAMMRDGTEYRPPKPQEQKEAA